MTSKVRIAARVRPRLEGEADDGEVQVQDSTITVRNPRDHRETFRFPFHSAYDQSTTQSTVFETDVEPLLGHVFQGVTATVFAYGVTSSGKTHTMQGSASDPGIIPRVLSWLFAHKPTPLVAYTMSYMEIYKDEAYDLLVPKSTAAPKLPIRQSPSGSVHVPNLSILPLPTLPSFQSAYTKALSNRSVASTLLNRASSRSHAVLTIHISLPSPTNPTSTLAGKINLVDLAGSENNKHTGNDPSRLAESAAINKSLSALGQVVHALNKGASRIPYRDSKLTRILQDALGGSSIGLLICNIAPGVKFRQDVLNTLNFAVRTKNVVNRVVVNERDNRPAPKPHFAALTTVPTAQAFTFNDHPQIPAANKLESNKRRHSLLPQPTSRIPSLQGMSAKEFDQRISKAVEVEVQRRLGHASSSADGEGAGVPHGILTPLLKRHRDLDEEVRKRLGEIERRYEQQLQAQLQALLPSTSTSVPDTAFDQGDESLEKEKETPLDLSPVSRKKTGRAYVALARTHSERGDLRAALDLYRKAEAYVPDNIKLKERIIDIEWAVENGNPFVPSPKPKVKGLKEKRERERERKSRMRDSVEFEADDVAVMSRNHRLRYVSERLEVMSEDQMDVDEVAGVLGGETLTETESEVEGGGRKSRGGRKAETRAFVGAELTNIKEEESLRRSKSRSPRKAKSKSKSQGPTRSSPRKKRTLVDAFGVDAEHEPMEFSPPKLGVGNVFVEGTPAKRLKRGKGKVEGFSEPEAPVKGRGF